MEERSDGSKKRDYQEIDDSKHKSSNKKSKKNTYSIEDDQEIDTPTKKLIQDLLNLET